MMVVGVNSIATLVLRAFLISTVPKESTPASMNGYANIGDHVSQLDIGFDGAMNAIHPCAHSKNCIVDVLSGTLLCLPELRQGCSPRHLQECPILISENTQCGFHVQS